MFEVTNLPFRLFCKTQGSNVSVTEFISVNHLLYVYSNNLQKENPVKYLIQTIPEEKPVGLQLFGYDVRHFIQLAKVFNIKNSGFDFLDLNIGCPVPKICATGSGSRLLADDKLETLEQILKGIIKSFPDMPFSIKMRAGYKSYSNIERLTEVLNSLDLLMVTIHPKLAVASETINKVDHSITKKYVELLNHPVIVNGDITSLKNEKELVEMTKASGSMIGRQAMRFPFVFNKKYQNEIHVTDFISGLKEILDLTLNHGFGKLHMIRDQILSMVRAFPGSKIKRSELQFKLHSINDLYLFVENLENYFKEKEIEYIPRIISKK